MRNSSRPSFHYSVSGCERPLRYAGHHSTGDEIHIWVEEKDILMRHDGAIYNCCAVVMVTLERQRPLLKLVELETYPTSEPCRCVCAWDISAHISNLAPGIYQVEVWNGMEPKLLARVEVTIPN